MDNHFYAVVAGPQLSGIITDWKKFTARELAAQIDREGRTWLLERLHGQKASHKVHSQHQVWQEGFHSQAILDDTMMAKAGIHSQQSYSPGLDCVTRALALFVRPRMAGGRDTGVALRSLAIN